MNWDKLLKMRSSSTRTFNLTRNSEIGVCNRLSGIVYLVICHILDCNFSTENLLKANDRLVGEHPPKLLINFRGESEANGLDLLSFRWIEWWFCRNRKYVCFSIRINNGCKVLQKRTSSSHLGRGTLFIFINRKPNNTNLTIGVYYNSKKNNMLLLRNQCVTKRNNNMRMMITIYFNFETETLVIFSWIRILFIWQS